MNGLQLLVAYCTVSCEYVFKAVVCLCCLLLQSGDHTDWIPAAHQCRTAVAQPSGWTWLVPVGL